ncbi:MAG: hypothetical protein Q8Q09_16180 [Deltaproteobacteria bacterium]|nr:hypothetical protein [Deltaproteobacteria bacterium]
MFQRQGANGVLCASCDKPIARGTQYLYVYEASSMRRRAGEAIAGAFHPLCAVEAYPEVVLNALDRTQGLFEGRAQIDAALSARLARGEGSQGDFVSAPGVGTRAEREQAIAAQVARSRDAARPLVSVAIMVHERFAATRMEQQLRSEMRSEQRSMHQVTTHAAYSFVIVGDELPDVEVEALRRDVDVLIVLASTVGGAMAPMRRTLWHALLSGVPFGGLWIVGDAPLASEARDRRELQVREELDAIGIDADVLAVAHSTQIDAAGLGQLAASLDERVCRDGLQKRSPLDAALDAFERLAAEGRWADAAKPLEVAVTRYDRALAPQSQSQSRWLRVGVQALEGDATRASGLRVLAHLQDPRAMGPLYALYRSITRTPGRPTPLHFVTLRLLWELGDARALEPLVDGCLQSVGTVREEFAALVESIESDALDGLIKARLRGAGDALSRENLRRLLEARHHNR